MKLVLWFLKKNGYTFGKIGEPVIMSSISADHCPENYRGANVFVRKDVLEEGLTKEFLDELGNKDGKRTT